MAAVWVTRIINNLDVDLTFDFTDATWRPMIEGHRYALGETIGVPKRQGLNQPTIVDLSYAMVGWAEWAHTRVHGPDGYIDLVVGPTNIDGNDYLKALDEIEKPVSEPLPVGPKGPGSTASADIHVTFDGDAPFMQIWSNHQVGADILKRFDDLATTFLKEVIKKIVGGIPLPGGGG